MKEILERLVYKDAADIREKIFRLILIVGITVCVVSIVAGLGLNHPLINAFPIIGMLAVMAISAVATFRYHKVEFATSLFAVLIICGVFPVVFFTSGGIEGGATVWFVLGILYIFIMFRGKKLVIFLSLATIINTGTYILAYYNQDKVVSLGSKMAVYYDSLFGVLVVGIAVGLIMRFQLHSYERERERTLMQKDEIEKAIKSKDDFFANMSHEIRTPINTIIGLNEMILREDLPDEVLEDALRVKNASTMLLTLINDILDFSQIESARMTFVPVAYRTKELFEDVIGLLQTRISEKNLDFYVDIESDLPSEMLGDEIRIKQILINILTNAEKYTQKGSVTLTVQGEEVREGVERLVISVTDTGIGIKKEDLESLYDYFKRIDREKNRKIEGSGLGLAITKQLLSLMGGTITVDSIYKKGSVFTVTLEQPIVDDTPVGNIDYLQKLTAGAYRHYKQSFEAPMAKILVVDDNETNLMVISKLLRATKVQVDTARSGGECLEMLQKKVYHVILLDSVMPEMDGTEVLRVIRRQESGMGYQTPVIAVTANASATDKQKYLEDGFDGYLAKPVDGALLEAEILKFLPDGLIEYRASVETKNTAAAKAVLRRKRKKIQISTDCASDLSPHYTEYYDIKMIYSYVKTENGTFRDTLEIDSDNLARHLSHTGSRALAVSAPVEEYEAFFAEALTEAEEVVHISLASGTGDAYSCASQASEGFDHVHVIDSGHLSCGQGLLVMSAGHLIRNGCNEADALCNELEVLKNQIETTFIMPNIQNYYASGHGGRVQAAFFNMFNLHPFVKVCQSSAKVIGFRSGNLDKARKSFIHKMLHKKDRIDDRVVFITHAGCTVREQEEFLNEVLKYVPFKNVIVQKASVSCASNGGLRSFGIAYLTMVDGKFYDKF